MKKHHEKMYLDAFACFKTQECGGDEHSAQSKFLLLPDLFALLIQEIENDGREWVIETHHLLVEKLEESPNSIVALASAINIFVQIRRDSPTQPKRPESKVDRDIKTIQSLAKRLFAKLKTSDFGLRGIDRFATQFELDGYEYNTFLFLEQLSSIATSIPLTLHQADQCQNIIFDRFMERLPGHAPKDPPSGNPAEGKRDEAPENIKDYILFDEIYFLVLLFSSILGEFDAVIQGAKRPWNLLEKLVEIIIKHIHMIVGYEISEVDHRHYFKMALACAKRRLYLR